MKVFVIGSGGREHALVWKIANDSARPRLYCAPGNAGTAELAVNLDIAATDIERLHQWALNERPDLTVVGPEAPLCAGLVDRFRQSGLRVFGPSPDAARIEGSKVFAKEVMLRGGVPTARAEVFTDPQAALAHVRSHGPPLVVKADGLAAGKGVLVCSTAAEAEAAVKQIMVEKVFGVSGKQVLIEECLEGEEASILALVDGEHAVLLASSQDHKRIFDNDQGPNTGGMGAYSPAPVVRDGLWPVIREQVFGRTLAELKKQGVRYQGVLYAGLMMTAAGPRVLEFNCRFGDPETQAILPRWNGDILPALQACVDGTLDEGLVRWRPEACVCVVMAAGGYPGSYAKGKVIEGLNEAGRRSGVVVFHAGTQQKDGRVASSGGRVLGVTALGKDLREAVRTVYEAVADIRFEGAHFRKDIAGRALRARA